MAERTCNICMNDSYEAGHVSYAYVCATCSSGYVCRGCIGKFDPCGSAFQDMKYVKKTIKCPCCRQLNWKYQFNQIIACTLGHDVFEYEPDTPAIMLYIHNSENY